MNAPLLSAVLDELRPRLLGRMLTKIETIGRYALLLRFSGARTPLYLSAHPELSRVGLVDTPPGFDPPRRGPEILTDSLDGATLESVEQEPGGRVVRWTFRREAERHARPTLVVELIPRFANLVLLGDDDKILWSRRDFPGAGRSREIRAGVRYVPPTKVGAEAAPSNAVPSPGANAHADALFRPREEAEDREALRLQLRRTLVRRREKAARGLRHVDRRLEDGSREPEMRRQAELLAAHLASAKRGMTSVTLTDFDGETSITIPLDPKLDPSGNVEELFRRARRLARSAEDLGLQRKMLEGELEDSDRTIARIEASPSDADLRELATRYLAKRGGDIARGAPPTSGAKKPNATPTGFAPRRYLLPGGWEVWVGRNAKQNDELTHKVSSPRDLWFHARGAQGSHTVLRLASGKGEPPRSVIEAAAAIAAFHSKARNSNLVPVAYTERRHVRKPRGAPPGTASVQREKVIFVAPGVPEGTAETD